jgi:hypothetical protein
MAGSNGQSKPKVYLVSKSTKKKYEVVAFDKETNVITLRSPDGKKFDFKDATKANIQKAGYDLVQA